MSANDQPSRSIYYHYVFPFGTIIIYLFHFSATCARWTHWAGFKDAPQPLSKYRMRCFLRMWRRLWCFEAEAHPSWISNSNCSHYVSTLNESAAFAPHVCAEKHLLFRLVIDFVSIVALKVWPFRPNERELKIPWDYLIFEMRRCNPSGTVLLSWC